MPRKPPRHPTREKPEEEMRKMRASPRSALLSAKEKGTLAGHMKSRQFMSLLSMVCEKSAIEIRENSGCVSLGDPLKGSSPVYSKETFIKN